jgi:hypothetical protein
MAPPGLLANDRNASRQADANINQDSLLAGVDDNDVELEDIVR